MAGENGARNSMKVPDSWTGGPNRWSSQERDQWKAFCLDPKGGDPAAGSGSRSRPVSHGANADDVDELYERMVQRGIVAAPKKKRGRK